jgi:hypothetical protein
MKTNRTDPTIEIVNGREKKKSSKITPSLSLSRHSFCVRKKKSHRPIMNSHGYLSKDTSIEINSL